MTTPRKLSSRYELGEILGFGGMSEVHLARDMRLSRDVAIKVLRADLARDPTFYLRFKREAQNAAALNHPAIVAVYDTGEAETDGGPLPYIVMEYVDGETLRDLVRSRGPLPPRRAMEIIADVCAALDFSHKNGIVHRDMKPANIMINRSGAVKVMDFGIARAISDSSSPMTQTAAVIGTAQYLSPEQARGEQVDARSDVYSVGCVLFEILTGEPPFTGDSPVSVAYQHVREEPRRPSTVYDGVPRELDAVILKAMSKNPANRYQSAADMRTDLVRVLGGQKPSAPTVMTDEDRTSLIGGSGTGPHRHRASGHRTTQGGGRGKSVALWVTAAVAAMVLGAFAFLMSPLGRGSQVTVPEVKNLTQQEAQATLEKQGFHVTIATKPSQTIATGKAIDTRPTSGSQAPKNSTVVLDISEGPQQVSVPRVLGLTQQEAQASLERQGLTMDANVLKADSSQTDKGKVVKQSEPAGQKADPGASIQITVGDGPKSVPIPNLSGKSLTEAQSELDKLGLSSTVVQSPSDQPKGNVVRTDPPAGTTVNKDTAVTIYQSSGAPVVMPNITGMTPEEAKEALAGVGWNGTMSVLKTGTLVGNLGVIEQQNPAAGTSIGPKDTISVTVPTHRGIN
ncbi:MAG: Stk1 family PASTA domain-containing Ser/Thr kinase [Mycobacteriaceae bacterium]|nr:Stk1 family PASTA domain-containing Ser/Thr kinase [Mycobacteriaceae bacterium]